jgi:uncharacterized repeat protein (TIGR03803 family)
MGHQIIRKELRWISAVLAVTATMIFTMLVPRVALAQTYKEKVLHTFTAGDDGAYPDFGGLIPDAQGNFWGVATEWGSISEDGGSLYKVDRTGKYRQVLAFQRPLMAPCSVAFDAATGNLYGVSGCATYNGGVWQYDVKRGKLTTMHTFTGAPDGEDPILAPVRDGAGNLYGSTLSGGIVNRNPDCSADGCGVVYKLGKDGKETVVYSFTGNADGSTPASLVLDAAGNIYGETGEGGLNTDNCQFGCGVVFKIDTKGNQSTLHEFSWSSTSTDGAHCLGHCLSFDATGTLWGISSGGGLNQCFGGCGTLFKINTKTGKYSVEHRFTANDGVPTDMVFDKAGNLWVNSWDSGTISERVNNKGKLIPLFTFNKKFSDGYAPQGPPAFDAEGNIYGVTSEGGTKHGYQGHCGGNSGCGVVFKLARP